MLNTFTVEAESGFNYFEYNIQYTEKGKSTYLKAHKEVEIKEAKNGVFYLIKGSYNVQISNEQNKPTQTMKSTMQSQSLQK